MRIFGIKPTYAICRFICQWVCTLYIRSRCFGLRHVPREGPVLLVCNHQSFMDPVLAGISLHREASFMARDTLFRHPLFGRLLYRLNAFPVRRGTADIGAIKESLRRLKQGHVLVVFPEGTRTPDGRIKDMLPGLGTIAKKARIPIVPTLIDGMQNAWPRARLLPRPGDVIVEYGPALWPEEYADLSVDELMNLLRARLVEMQNRWHGRRRPSYLQ